MALGYRRMPFVARLSNSLIGSLLADLIMSSASLLSLVSSRLASITQKVLVRWYEGGRD